jgi:8-oxo-dGTP diphosphatase
MAGMRVSVVGAALLREGCVLASRRTGPPHLAGFWEFPGGKVEDGESDEQALRRELREELGCEAVVGARLGHDLLIGETAVMRVYLATLVSGEPQLVDHDAHRWLAAHELHEVPWIPVDAPLLPVLRAQLLGSNLAGPSGGAVSL